MGSAQIFQLRAPGLLSLIGWTEQLLGHGLPAWQRLPRYGLMAHKESSKAEERTAQKRQKALDKQFAKASAGAFTQGHASNMRVVCHVVRHSPDTILQPPQQEVSQSGAASTWSPEDLVTHPQRPGPSGVTCKTPEATFTPTVVGLCPGGWQEQDMPPFIQQWIDRAIRGGIAEGIRQHQHLTDPGLPLDWDVDPLGPSAEGASFYGPASPEHSGQNWYSQSEGFQGEGDFPIFSRTPWTDSTFKVFSTLPSSNHCLPRRGLLPVWEWTLMYLSVLLTLENRKISCSQNRP